MSPQLWPARPAGLASAPDVDIDGLLAALWWTQRLLVLLLALVVLQAFAILGMLVFLWVRTPRLEPAAAPPSPNSLALPEGSDDYEDTEVIGVPGGPVWIITHRGSVYHFKKRTHVQQFMNQQKGKSPPVLRPCRKCTELCQ